MGWQISMRRDWDRQIPTPIHATKRYYALRWAALRPSARAFGLSWLGWAGLGRRPKFFFIFAISALFSPLRLSSTPTTPRKTRSYEPATL